MVSKQQVIPLLISEGIFNRKLKRLVKKEEKYYFNKYEKIPQSEIYNCELNAIKTELNNFERFNSKLCGGSGQNFKVKKCGSCKNIVEYKSDGKTPIVYPVVCESPFCDNPDCITHRKLKAKLLFDVFLWGNRNWIRQREITEEDFNKDGDLKKHLHKINHNGKIYILYTRWEHWDFGFKRRPDLPSRLQLENFRIRLNNFFKSLRKELHFYIKGVGIRDIADDIEKVGEEYFFHFHMALRYFNHNDPKIMKKIQSIGKRFDLIPHFIGHRECYNLSEYFAKRHSGQFEHESTGTNWMFKDIMDKKTYFRLFYNSKKLIHTGFTKKELEYIKEMFKQKLKELNQTLEESLLSPKDKEQSRCPYCNSTNIIFGYYPKSEIKHFKPPDSPPEALKLTIEHIKILN